MEMDTAEMPISAIKAKLKAAKRDPHSLRERKCEMGLLNRADGSCAYAQGDTVVWASVFGPGDLRASKQVYDQASLEVNFKSKIATSSAAEECGNNLESLLIDVCSCSLLLRQFPRTLISLTVQELHNDGSVSSASVNACCLALLDAGLPMRGSFCAVTAIVDQTGTIHLDPNAKALQSTVAKMDFAFVNTGADCISLSGCSAEGEFSHEQFRHAQSLSMEASKVIFAFYREAVERKYSGEDF